MFFKKLCAIAQYAMQNKAMPVSNSLEVGATWGPIEAIDPETGEVLWSWTKHNLTPNASRSYVQAAAFTGAGQYTSFYIGVYGNDRAPLYTDTASGNLAEYGELSSFVETERQLWEPAAESGGVLESSLNPAIFTANQDIAAIYGVFLITSQPFGANNGILISAVQSPSPESLATGAQLRVPCSITLTT